MAPGIRVAALLLFSSACVFDGDAVGSGDPGQPGEPLADAAATDPDPAEPEPEPDAGTPAGGEDAGGPADLCPPHQVRARRHHAPPRAEDGRLEFRDRRWLQVPAELPVTSGNAGDHCAYIDFQRGGNVVRCIYLGGADESTPVPGSAEWGAGLRYVFSECTDDPSEEEACSVDEAIELDVADALEVDEVRVRIDDGAYAGGDPAAYDPTQIDVAIDEDCDRRGDGGGDGDGDGDRDDG